MRLPLLVGLFVLVAVPAVACVPTPPITVVHVGRKPVTKNEDSGDDVKLRRPPADSYAGVHSGAYVIRTADDWQKMWKNTEGRGRETPPFPDAVDPTTEMMMVLATEDAIVSRLHVEHAVESGGLVTFFVRQTMLGEGCVRRAEERVALDAVVTTRIDKPIKFVIEDEDGPSCGEPPKAEVSCRLAAAQSWAPKLTAKAGDVVECELSSIARGKYELVDQMLSLQDLPPGSKAKLSFPKGPTRATIALDTFGTYAIRAEATDEAGRKGRATALIDVLPKKSRDVVLQLTWNEEEAPEVVSPPPRVLLRVTQDGPRGQRCSSEVPVPGLCEAKTRGAYTHMRIPASRRKLPVSLLYLDERPQIGAAPCVTVWFNGDRTATLCDHDHRHAEDRWELGTLDTTTGKIAPPKPAEPKPIGPSSASAAPKSGKPSPP